MIVFTIKGAEMILRAYFNNTWASSGKNLTLKLFTNDHNPSMFDITANYIEASGGGYIDITLANGSWNIIPDNTPVEIDYAISSFIFSGPLSGNPAIYGYYVVDSDNNLIMMDRNNASFTPFNNGDNYDVTIKIQTGSGTPDVS